MVLPGHGHCLRNGFFLSVRVKVSEGERCPGLDLREHLGETLLGLGYVEIMDEIGGQHGRDSFRVRRKSRPYVTRRLEVERRG